jgi:hypothetical protein
MAKKIIEFKEAEWAKLETLCSVSCSLEMAADWLGCSKDTIRRRIKENFATTFEKYRNVYLNQTRIKLKQEAVMRALDGNNTMLIFCLKNLCGWTDKTESPKDEKTIPQNVLVQIPANTREGK